ncbi:hypothetical protein VPH35_067896 [Triticum aestivum]
MVKISTHDICGRLVCVISLGFVCFNQMPTHATQGSKEANRPSLSIHPLLLLLLCFASMPSHPRIASLLSSPLAGDDSPFFTPRRKKKEKERKKMADSGGGGDWEVVSLTASTYAAAPGPIQVSPLLHAAHKTAESPLLLLPNPPAPPAHFFMSQHFNLPPLFTSTHPGNNKGGQELQESGPAVPDGDASDDADGLNMPISPENYCHSESEREDVLLLASPAGNGLGLQVEGGGDQLQPTTTPCSLPDVAAGSDAAAPAPASGGVAGNAAQAQVFLRPTLLSATVFSSREEKSSVFCK